MVDRYRASKTCPNGYSFDVRDGGQMLASGKSEKNLERLNLGLACLMLAKPK